MSGILATRIRLLKEYFRELRDGGVHAGRPPTKGDILILLDGVGGWLAAPLIIQRTLRRRGAAVRCIIHNWHRGVPGNFLSDLMVRRKNEIQAVQVARLVLRLRRENPDTPLHLLGHSGGAALAVFAAQRLPCPGVLNRLILVAAALSPRFNLSEALARVDRCYACMSRKDWAILGLGTRLLGTVDRRFVGSAGWRGFQRPEGWNDRQEEAYRKLRQISWRDEFRRLGHSGGHNGWLHPNFIANHLPLLLADRPVLDFHEGPFA